MRIYYIYIYTNMYKFKTKVIILSHILSIFILFLMACL